jgi:hypothetical protein
MKKIFQKNNRVALFLVGCIGSRLLLTYLAKTSEYKKIIAYLCIIIAIVFLYIYLTKSRTTGPEVFGEKIWWNSLRPVHAFMYLMFGILALKNKSYAWKFLFVDTMIGLSAYILYRF